MFNRPHRIGPRVRLVLARRPWLRWVVVMAIALAVGWNVKTRLDGVDDARSAWTDQRTVLVASLDHEPGDALVVESRILPAAASPRSALTVLPPGATVRQHVAHGEVVTETDVASGNGPAAAAESGEVVVAVSDPILSTAMSTVSVGLRVSIHSEGIVLANDARITAVDGDVVFVALDVEDATAVSAAAQLRIASIAFVR